jgi:hypothetical protein
VSLGIRRYFKKEGKRKSESAKEESARDARRERMREEGEGAEED